MQICVQHVYEFLKISIKSKDISIKSDLQVNHDSSMVKMRPFKGNYKSSF